MTRPSPHDVAEAALLEALASVASDDDRAESWLIEWDRRRRTGDQPSLAETAIAREAAAGISRWLDQVKAGDARAAAAFLSWRWPDRYPVPVDATIDDVLEWTGATNEATARRWLHRYGPPWPPLERRRSVNTDD